MKLNFVEIYDAGSDIMDDLPNKTAIGLGGANEAKLKLSSIKIGSKWRQRTVRRKTEPNLAPWISLNFMKNQGPAVSMAANNVQKLNNAGGNGIY